MSQSRKVLEAAQKLTPFDLPIGVYLVTRDGSLIECNRQVREIMGLPLEGSVSANIKEFYCDAARREALLAKIRQVEEGGRWVEEVIPLKVGGKEKFVEDYARSIRDESDEIIGLICCMVDVTKEEHYKHFFQSLPVGIYQLNERDEFVEVNDALVRILGHASADELIGTHVGALYVNADEADELRRKIEEKGAEVNFKAELRRKDGETIFVAVSAHKLTAPDGGYAGREGTVMDVTTEERYRKILEDVPVGLYEIRAENGHDRIRHCNEQFASIFEFNSREEVIGFDAKQLFVSSEEYTRYVRELERRSTRNEALHGFSIHVKSRKGKNLTFEVNSRPIKDRRGRVIGRAGAIRDITEEAALRDKVKEFTFDFGSVLHDYTSTLVMIQHSIEPVIKSLAPDPFGDDPALLPEETSAIIAEPARSLAASLGALLELARSHERAAVLATGHWETLRNLHDTLLNYEEQIPIPDIRPLVLADAAAKILNICGQIRGRFPKELLRQLRGEARELTRVTNLLSLHQARNAIIEMDHQVRSLGEYVTSDMSTKEPPVVSKISSLISQARRNLDKFAVSRNVRFEVKRDGPDPLVRVVPRHVVRTLANLLHNAIKYSWSRGHDKPPWVSIRTSVVDHQVCIEVENWGVPVEKEELENDLIFHLGYRGRQSGDRGRIGTGIGLTDARRVARAHGGDVTIKSQPSVFGKREDDYTQPFKTTVTLKLPIFDDGGPAHEN